MTDILPLSAHLDLLDVEGEAFVAACERTDPAAVVAGCPGWSGHDLLWHLTEVDDLWRAVVEDGSTDPRGRTRPVRPSDAELPARFRAGRTHLVDVFRRADPGAPAWSWAPGATVSWVVRRLAHETVVHRWDAELAAGLDPVIDPAVASDGIDEFLFEMIGRVSPGAAEAGGSVHLHCTDVDGEWTVRPQDGGPLVVTREHAKGDAAIRGGASDLLLVLWRRVPLSTVDVIGATDVAERFVAG